jgi:alpha-tubulin suppressor-like RCC1 family protein
MVSGLTGVTAVTARFYHTCALVGGAAKCWGDNDCGQLGDNDTNSFYRTAPIQVLGLTSGVTAIAAGAYHTCAVVNGGAKCWGANDYGQLGNNSTIHSVVPIDVLGLSSNVTAIATGHRHSCALVAGGVKCWGFNGNALLGNNSSSDSLVPTQVLDLTSNVTAITAGSFHNCALVEGGAKCWGQNGRGKLGNNDDTGSSSSVPVQVFGLTGGVTTIVGGFEHTCSLVNGVMDCWGYNFYGQLGNNSTTDSFVPVEVQGP